MLKSTLQAVGFSLCFANLAFATPKATPLSTIAFTQADLNKLCQQLPNGCEGEPEKGGIYTDKKDFYFIDGGRQIALLEKTADFFKVKTLWDFKAYQHTYEPDENLTIYPAFYPLNAEKKAIAMLITQVESFSGGGRTTETADFIELKEDGSYKVALSEIPFYFSELIRACFSLENEYTYNPHCHDENSSILSIKFREHSPYYQWDLTYIDTNWQAGVSEKMKKVKRSKPITVIPYQQNEKEKQAIEKIREVQ